MHRPTQTELETYPHVILLSLLPWDPNNISFPKIRLSVEEMMSDMRHVSSTTFSSIEDVAGNVFNLSTIVRRISLMQTTLTDLAVPDECLIGCGDVPPINTFQSLSRHSDVTPQSLSERWCISIPTAALTLKKTTQCFLRSAILPLGRRYQTDRVFTQKTLARDWSTDTMDGWCKPLDGCQYAQIFANKHYFSRIYPMDSKCKAGDAL